MRGTQVDRHPSKENAIRWALAHKVPIRCFDLQAAHMSALRDEEKYETPSRPDAFK
jgi:hypothetical protein